MTRSQHLDLVTGHATDVLVHEPSSLSIFIIVVVAMTLVLLSLLFFADKEGNLTFDSYSGFKNGVVKTLQDLFRRK